MLWWPSCFSGDVLGDPRQFIGQDQSAHGDKHYDYAQEMKLKGSLPVCHLCLKTCLCKDQSEWMQELVLIHMAAWILFLCHWCLVHPEWWSW
jgi:hypothetical protein